MIPNLVSRLHLGVVRESPGCSCATDNDSDLPIALKFILLESCLAHERDGKAVAVIQSIDTKPNPSCTPWFILTHV